MTEREIRKPSHTRRWLAAQILVLLAFTLAQGQRRERSVDSWRPTHYDVTLKLNDQLSEVSSARTELSVLVLKGPLAALDLDFGEMPVDSVTVKGTAAPFEQSGGKLIVRLPEPARKDERLSIVVNYHGRPKDGLVMTADKAGKPSATGDNWPDRVHHWIPSLDHPSAKATVRFTVTAPARDTVVANGLLAETRNNPDSTRTWTYTETNPIPPYCMIIAVGEYARSEPLTRSAWTHVEYYVPQTDRDYAVQGFSATVPTVAFFSQRVAPYPYEKLAMIVGATRFGGMENSGAIVFSSTLFDNKTQGPPLSPTFKISRSIMEVTAHEVAHQWFGDSVSIKTWADLWLSEGFAVYFAGLFVEQYEGKDAFRDFMQRAAEKYLAYSRGRMAPIYDTETQDLFKLLNANNYQKGAWVLHMLRGLLGDRSFFKGIRDYYLQNARHVASTEDLRAALEGASGKDLKEFFRRWVYGSGHPRYQFSWDWQAKSSGRGELVINLRQTQEGEPFMNPLQAEVVTAKGPKRVTLTPTGKESRLTIPLEARPMDVRLDPDGFVLKEMVRAQSARQGANLWRYSAEFMKPLIITR